MNADRCRVCPAVALLVAVAACAEQPTRADAAVDQTVRRDASPGDAADDAGRRDALAADALQRDALAPADALPADALPADAGFTPQGCDVWLGAGDDFGAVSAARPAGTRYCIRQGLYRMPTTIRAKDGDSFVGERGAILSGARDISAGQATWTAVGSAWCVGGQTQEQNGTYDRAMPIREGGNPRDAYPEELFVDDVRYKHVGALAELGPGKWFFDYGADRICLGVDPQTLGLIETSVTPLALRPQQANATSGVTIENLVFEKFAGPWRFSPINGLNEVGRDWTIRYVESRHNHGSGIGLGPGYLLEHSKLHDNGFMGLHGAGKTRDATPYYAPIVVRHNELFGNMPLDVNWGNEGGFKIAVCEGCRVENNWVHDNGGPGIWFDIDNVDTVIRGNLVENNREHGIFYEISYKAEIAYNVVHGSKNRAGDSGMGIYISSSRDVEVHHNVVWDTRHELFIRASNRGTGNRGVYEPTGCFFHDNHAQIVDGAAGLRVAADAPGAAGYVSAPFRNIRFVDNRYELREPAGKRFYWPTAVGSGSGFAPAEWVALGHDSGGRFSYADPPAKPPLPAGAPYFVKRWYGPR